MEKLKITDQDKQILRKSWNLLVDFSEEISVYHYESLFKYDPKVKLLFKRDMRNHGLILMDFFQTLMDQIENLSVVEPYLQRLGIRHKGYRVKKNNYALFEQTLIDAFIWGLTQTNQLSGENEIVWTKLVKFVTSNMLAGLKKK